MRQGIFERTNWSWAPPAIHEQKHMNWKLNHCHNPLGPFTHRSQEDKKIHCFYFTYWFVQKKKNLNRVISSTCAFLANSKSPWWKKVYKTDSFWKEKTRVLWWDSMCKITWDFNVTEKNGVVCILISAQVLFPIGPHCLSCSSGGGVDKA